MTRCRFGHYTSTTGENTPQVCNWGHCEERPEPYPQCPQGHDAAPFRGHDLTCIWGHYADQAAPRAI